MPGKAVERKAAELTSKVNIVESMATYQTVRGQYRTDSNGKRQTIVEGKSVQRPYSYFNVVEGRVQTLNQLRDALSDIHEHGQYPIARLVADINHGLEYCGRDALAQGLDPAMTDKQRSVISTVRKLKDDGLGDFDLWSGLLGQVGLSPEQIEEALT